MNHSSQTIALRHLFGALAFILSILLSAQALAGTVLLLDYDDGDDVEASMIQAGHEVTRLDYDLWVGTNPAPEAFDLVFLLNADYGYELGQSATPPDIVAPYQALEAYVRGGGVFATTAWTAFSMYDNDDPVVMTALDPIVPFDYTTGVVDATYDYSGTYEVTVSASPLTAGLPATWNAVVEADGGDCIALKPGAISVIERDFDYSNDLAGCPAEKWPGLAYISIDAGTGIWLNSDLGYEDDADVTPELLQVINNIVAFASPSTTATPVPALADWVLTLLALMMGLLGATYLRSRYI
ncbi:MAG: hypothetical protein ACJA09_003524 [Alcanivorax sp.]|jgi:hypothetical protein